MHFSYILVGGPSGPPRAPTFGPGGGLARAWLASGVCSARAGCTGCGRDKDRLTRATATK